MSYGSVVINFSNRPNIEIESILKLYNELIKSDGCIFVNTNAFFKCGDSSKIKKIVHDLGFAKTQLITSIKELKKVLKSKPESLWVGSYYSYEILGEIFE